MLCLESLTSSHLIARVASVSKAFWSAADGVALQLLNIREGALPPGEAPLRALMIVQAMAPHAARATPRHRKQDGLYMVAFRYCRKCTPSDPRFWMTEPHGGFHVHHATVPATADETLAQVSQRARSAWRQAHTLIASGTASPLEDASATWEFYDDSIEIRERDCQLDASTLVSELFADKEGSHELEKEEDRFFSFHHVRVLGSGAHGPAFDQLLAKGLSEYVEDLGSRVAPGRRGAHPHLPRLHGFVGVLDDNRYFPYDTPIVLSVSAWQARDVLTQVIRDGDPGELAEYIKGATEAVFHVDPDSCLTFASTVQRLHHVIGAFLAVACAAAPAEVFGEGGVLLVATALRLAANSAFDAFLPSHATWPATADPAMGLAAARRLGAIAVPCFLGALQAVEEVYGAHLVDGSFDGLARRARELFVTEVAISHRSLHPRGQGATQSARGGRAGSWLAFVDPNLSRLALGHPVYCQEARALLERPTSVVYVYRCTGAGMECTEHLGGSTSLSQ